MKHTINLNDISSITFEDVIKMSISAVLIFIVLLLCIRVLGKRSTSELRSFDWIVTFSVGSVFASTIMDNNVSIAEGSYGILIIFLLQFSTTALIKKYKWLRKIVSSKPRLLLFKGKFIEENLKKERILKEEIYAAARQKGFSSVKNIYAVVIETNSTISVIGSHTDSDVAISLKNVSGLPKELEEDLRIQD